MLPWPMMSDIGRDPQTTNNKPLCIWITLRNIFLIILYANVVVLPVKQGSATPWGLQLCMKNSNKYNQNWEFILISLITIEKCWPILTWKSGNFHLTNSSKYSPFEQNVCQFLARNQRANNKWRAHWSQSLRIDNKKYKFDPNFDYWWSDEFTWRTAPPLGSSDSREKTKKHGAKCIKEQLTMGFPPSGHL